MISLHRFTYFLTLGWLLLCSSCQDQQRDTLKIATASNMQFAMKELVEVFTSQTGIECDLIISSSGKLTAQIIEGAPYDIFLSADMAYPSRIFEAGFAEHSPAVYAYGKLVIWSMKEMEWTKDLSSLTHADINHIAMASPKTAPYGRAALEVIRSQGLESEIEDKLVYGESISQVNQFVTSEAAEVGFTALSVVLAKGDKKRGFWYEIDPSLHDSIAQGVVIMRQEVFRMKLSMAFYQFLFSPEARNLLKDFGYSVSE